MTLKAVKPGRFKPSCTACKVVFSLRVSDGDPVTIEASAIPSATPSSDTGAGDSRRTDNARSSAGDGRSREIKPRREESGSAAAPRNTVPQRSPGAGANPTNDGETIIQPTREESAFSVTLDAAPDLPSLGPASRAETRLPKTRPNTRPASHVSSGKSSAAVAAPMPQQLGGYRILSELGRGGMGAVYLARQLSLARNVALKTVQAQWAQHPGIIARFIREAYAAAQLTHHNVVQIYDLGQDQGTSFFSMELVKGKSLEEVTAQHGKMDPRTATTCILQAARGLKFAHDNGMVHRDVKPANLMLSDEGLVKVADLGLVKTAAPVDDDIDDDDDRRLMLASANTKVTGAGSTMGTPAYMSPEQADDAAQVDHRADIYSLGCTFFTLLTGKPPFTAGSVIEVITKHKTQPVVRSGALSADVPPELGRILQRMTEKKPEDRYQDLSETISDLERFLETGKPVASQSQTDYSENLLAAAQEFARVPATKLRTIAPLVLGLGCLLLCVITFWISWKLMASVILMTAIAPVTTVVLCGIVRGCSPIAERLRGLVYGASWKDWLNWTLAILMITVLSLILSLAGFLVLAFLLASGLALIYLTVVDKPLGSQREPILHRAEKLLRELRLSGMSESALQQFVMEKSGRDWEELFEALFGYDEMRRQRKTLNLKNKTSGRQQAGSFRDRVADRLDLQTEKLRQQNERRVLEALERKRLKAKGLSDSDARRQASLLAATMVGAATEARKSMAEFSQQSSPREVAAHRERIKAMLRQASTGKSASGSFSINRGIMAALSWLLPGMTFRFLLGGMLLALCGLWARQNNLLTSENLQELKDAAARTSESLTNANADELSRLRNAVLSNESATALNLPVIGPYFHSFAPGILGLLIMASGVLISGWRFSVFAIAATGVTLVLPATTLLPFAADWISLAIGIGILALGWVISGRRRAAA